MKNRRTRLLLKFPEVASADADRCSCSSYVPGLRSRCGTDDWARVHAVWHVTTKSCFKYVRRPIVWCLALVKECGRGKRGRWAAAKHRAGECPWRKYVRM